MIDRATRAMPREAAPRPVAARPTAPPAHVTCEADVVEGLEDIARDELRRLFGDRLAFRGAGDAAPGALRFAYAGDLGALFAPRTILAVNLVAHFPVPRPRALLGDQHFRALLAAIATVRGLLPPESYRTLYLSAAGAESATLLRLKEELARGAGLIVTAPEGDLQLRLRRPPGGGAGWEALLRLSPRPLGARPWRVCNLEGALNATVARAMAILGEPRPDDVFLNLACGSGSLLIERAAQAPAGRIIGCDTSAAALACAGENIAAAGFAGAIETYGWDARALMLPPASVDALCADLPFGHLVGSHAENILLYPDILREAARVARPGAPFVLITHEVRLMEALLARSTTWAMEEVRRVALGGLHPRIFVLRRR